MKLKQNQLLLLLAVLVGLFVYHNRDRLLSKEGFEGGDFEDEDFEDEDFEDEDFEDEDFEDEDFEDEDFETFGDGGLDDLVDY